MGETALDHFTIDVSDLDKAQRFYCEGLGFAFVGEESFGREVARLAQVTGDFRVRSRYIQLGEVMIVLRRIEVPPQNLPPPRKQLGLANLALRVPQLESSIVAVEAAGGTVLHESRTALTFGETGTGHMILCQDPDGTLIELIQPPSQG